jgi:hypothetical protein
MHAEKKFNQMFNITTVIRTVLFVTVLSGCSAVHVNEDKLDHNGAKVTFKTKTTPEALFIYLYKGEGCSLKNYEGFYRRFRADWPASKNMPTTHNIIAEEPVSLLLRSERMFVGACKTLITLEFEKGAEYIVEYDESLKDCSVNVTPVDLNVEVPEVKSQTGFGCNFY